ncbi:MAG: hypothetical protein JO283_19165 [Bradyrhizobium sp.]|nr:hypothetical protein [Bradyrhizobium sp.]
MPVGVTGTPLELIRKKTGEPPLRVADDAQDPFDFLVTTPATKLAAADDATFAAEVERSVATAPRAFWNSPSSNRTRI